MPFHIEEVTSEVTVIDGDLPLTAAQVEKLVKLICRRLEEKGRDAVLAHEASAIRRHVAPPLRIGD
jgi:hypothetical protein